MFNSEAFQEFREAVTLLRDDQPESALAHIQHAVALDPRNAYYLSYQGVILARAEGKWADAEMMCSSALQLERKHAQLYLNLSEVYVGAGRRQDAADALTRGMEFAGSDYRLELALQKLCTRRAPVVKALPRGHGLNRQLGRLRHLALMVLNPRLVRGLGL